MLTKAEAMKRARRLPGPPVRDAMRIKPIEVALAWMELHGYESAKTEQGNPIWVGDLLAVKAVDPHMGTSGKEGCDG